MTIRETTTGKLQKLPDSLLQQVSDFIDFLMHQQDNNPTAKDYQDELDKAWAQWFESVEHLESVATDIAGDYQQHLLLKYRHQGLEL